jgi:hypothetical protein
MNQTRAELMSKILDIIVGNRYPVESQKRNIELMEGIRAILSQSKTPKEDLNYAFDEVVSFLPEAIQWKNLLFKEFLRTKTDS